MRLITCNNPRSDFNQLHRSSVNLNREYTPLYKIAGWGNEDLVEIFKTYIKNNKKLENFSRFSSYIHGYFEKEILYFSDCYSQVYRNSKGLKNISALEYLGNSNYRCGNMVKKSGAFSNGGEIFYMLFIKTSYVYEFWLRHQFDLPIDYSNLEFCIHPKMLTVPYSAWFNPIVPDLVKMNEAGVTMLITDNIISRILPPDLAYISNLDDRKEKEQELGRIFSQKLRDKFYGQVAESADLPF